jgi:hypothetical protein
MKYILSFLVGYLLCLVLVGEGYLIPKYAKKNYYKNKVIKKDTIITK